MDFFKTFVKSRERLEKVLIDKKVIITQALQIARSKVRFERACDLFEFLIKKCAEGHDVTDEEVVKVMVPNSDPKILAINQNASSAGFSNDTKSQIYLRESVRAALKCKICNGLIEPKRSISYDHIERVRDGGLGNAHNGQMTHPYCNTSIKN